MDDCTIKDDVLEYPNFSEWFSSSKDIRTMKTNIFLGIDGSRLLIYSISLIISIALIIPYLVCEKSGLVTNTLMSIGASGVGASFLSYFIDFANSAFERKKTVQNYNNSAILIYNNLWLVFANRSYSYMQLFKTDHEKTLAATSSAQKHCDVYQMVVPQIDNFLLVNASILDANTTNYFSTLKSQLINFQATLQNPVDANHLITALDGTRQWLRDYCKKENYIKAFIK